MIFCKRVLRPEIRSLPICKSLYIGDWCGVMEIALMVRGVCKNHQDIVTWFHCNFVPVLSSWERVCRFAFHTWHGVFHWYDLRNGKDLPFLGRNHKDCPAFLSISKSSLCIDSSLTVHDLYHKLVGRINGFIFKAVLFHCLFDPQFCRQKGIGYLKRIGGCPRTAGIVGCWIRVSGG